MILREGKTRVPEKIRASGPPPQVLSVVLS